MSIRCRRLQPTKLWGMTRNGSDSAGVVVSFVLCVVFPPSPLSWMSLAGYRQRIPGSLWSKMHTSLWQSICSLRVIDSFSHEEEKQRMKSKLPSELARAI